MTLLITHNPKITAQNLCMKRKAAFMQTHTTLPAVAKNRPATSKIVLGTLLVIVYLVTVWIFIGAIALVVGGGRASATITYAGSTDGNNTSGDSIGGDGTAYTLHFKNAATQKNQDVTVTTTYDLGKVNDQVNIIYNQDNPDSFIIDSFGTILAYLSSKCLFFLTFTPLLIWGFFRWRKANRKLA